MDDPEGNRDGRVRRQDHMAAYHSRQIDEELGPVNRLLPWLHGLEELGEVPSLGRLRSLSALPVFPVEQGRWSRVPR